MPKIVELNNLDEEFQSPLPGTKRNESSSALDIASHTQKPLQDDSTTEIPSENFTDKSEIKSEARSCMPKFTARSFGKLMKTKHVVKSSQSKIHKSEEVFEGFGKEVISSSHSFAEKPTVFTLERKEGLRQFFENCNPDDDGMVSTLTLIKNFEIRFNEIFTKSNLDSLKKHVMRQSNDTMDFQTFYIFLESWVEETFTEIDVNETFSDSLIPNNNYLNANLDDTLRVFDFDFNDIKEDIIFQQCQIGNDDMYRRSTLIHHDKIFANVLQNEFFFPSPIRISEANNSSKTSTNRTVSKDFEDSFNFTIGSLEAEANITPLDPTELQHEIFELTYANKKLTHEKDELASLNFQGESAQFDLREKCRNLEDSLHQAQNQLGKLRKLEEDNKKLKSELVEEFQHNIELKNSLNQCQNDHQNLLRNFEALKEEAQSTSERLQVAIQEKDLLHNRISECVNEINNLKCKIQDCNEKLNFKDSKLENHEKTVVYYETVIQQLEEEKCNILGELHKIRNDYRDDEIHKAFMSEIVPTDDSSLEADQSQEQSQSTCISRRKENETGTTSSSNIREEIFSLNLSDTGSALPFCEKDNSFASSISSSQNLADSLQKFISKYQQWNQTSSSYANYLASKGAMDDVARAILKNHVDELISATSKWKELLNLQLECEVPCNNILPSSDETFLITLLNEECRDQISDISSLEAIPMVAESNDTTENRSITDVINEGRLYGDMHKDSLEYLNQQSTESKFKYLNNREIFYTNPTGLDDIYLQMTLNSEDLLQPQKDDTVVSSSTESILQPQCMEYEQNNNNNDDKKNSEIVRTWKDICGKCEFKGDTENTEDKADTKFDKNLCQNLDISFRREGTKSISVSDLTTRTPPAIERKHVHPFVRNIILVLTLCLFVILVVASIFSFFLYKEFQNCYCNTQCWSDAFDNFSFVRIIFTGSPPF